MRIRKNICFLISMLLLVSQTGLAFNIHYCGSRIASVSLGVNAISHDDAEKNCCGSKPKSDNKKCCSNKTVTQKSQRDIIKVAPGFDHPAVATSHFSLLQPNLRPEAEITSQNETVHSDAHSPPLYELYCQLVFYA
ncbi:MAG: hypothetical protein EOO51_03460 [Flavobacterium sp.]|nr:MAG: hypothetical protein EOO51_03460 [Flavobacterium sp.]